MYKVKLIGKDGHERNTFTVFAKTPKEIYDWVDSLIDCLNDGRYEVSEDTAIPVERPR